MIVPQVYLLSQNSEWGIITTAGSPISSILQQLVDKPYVPTYLLECHKVLNEQHPWVQRCQVSLFHEG
jgi:hypothetical protein